jgi:hypothetical protein
VARKQLHKPLEVEGALAVFDEEMVKAAFWLAHEDITTREQAAAVFGVVIERVGDWADMISIPSSSNFINNTDPRDVPTFDTEDWATGQSLMRKWLPDLKKFDDLSAKQSIRLLREISETSESLGHSLRMRLNPYDRRLEWATERDTIANACCRAALPFIMPGGWSPQRIGRCLLEKCGKWFLRPEPKRGAVQNYCTPQHANVAKVAAYRERQRQLTGKTPRKRRSKNQPKLVHIPRTWRAVPLGNGKSWGPVPSCPAGVVDKWEKFRK